MIARRFHVFGRVQGVYYRASAQQKAIELGLKGYVCNLSDGSVRLDVVGPEARVQEMELWCMNGSPLAKVDRVEAEEIEMEEYAGFDIR